MDQFSYRISGLQIGVILMIFVSGKSAWAESPDMRIRKKLIAIPALAVAEDRLPTPDYHPQPSMTNGKAATGEIKF